MNHLPHGRDQSPRYAEAAIELWELLFGFRGRINRARYWLALTILCGAAMVVSLFGYAAGETLAFRVFSHAFNLAVFLATIAVGIKRLHDRDRSGWWLAVFYIGPLLVAAAGGLLLWTAAGSLSDGRYVALFLLRLCFVGAFALALWGVVETGFLRGTTGYNRFGADPLAGRPRRRIRAVQRAR